MVDEVDLTEDLATVCLLLLLLLDYSQA